MLKPCEVLYYPTPVSFESVSCWLGQTIVDPLKFQLGCSCPLHDWMALAELSWGLMVLWEPTFVGVITGVWASQTYVKVHLCHSTWLWSIESIGGLGFGAIFLRELLEHGSLIWQLFTFLEVVHNSQCKAVLVVKKSTWSQIMQFDWRITCHILVFQSEVEVASYSLVKLGQQVK